MSPFVAPTTSTIDHHGWARILETFSYLGVAAEDIPKQGKGSECHEFGCKSFDKTFDLQTPRSEKSNMARPPIHHGSGMAQLREP